VETTSAARAAIWPASASTFLAATRVLPSLADVVTKRKAERMRSFVIAEALDYFWWLFSPPAELDLDGVVFKTQAHALRRVADPVEAALPLRRRRRPSASH
jgi:hypothetical protein